MQKPEISTTLVTISAFLNVGTFPGGYCSGAKKTAPGFIKGSDIRTPGRGTAVAL
jgi:hypothetical protein